MNLCHRSQFSRHACANANQILSGHMMAPSLAKPICLALLSTPISDDAAELHLGVAL